MTQTQLDKFLALREKVFAEIKKILAIDGHCKHYEGALTLSKHLPNYFDTNGKTTFAIHLACSLLCSYNEESWHGDTWDEALEKFEAWVNKLGEKE